MDDPDLLKDVRFLRDVVARTQPPAVNHFWPVTLSWGCVVTAGYLACAFLGMAGKIAILPWVWPVLIGLVALPLHWYLGRKARSRIEERGVRPRFRRDLMWCWLSIAAVGLLWTAAVGISGLFATHWYVLSFVWGSLYFVGYVVNGVLLSTEWLWAAAVLLASLIAAFLAGSSFYWLPGFWIGGTFLLAGLLGRRNARRPVVQP
jgi:hypothetical protein